MISSQRGSLVPVYMSRQSSLLSLLVVIFLSGVDLVLSVQDNSPAWRKGRMRVEHIVGLEEEPAKHWRHSEVLAIGQVDDVCWRHEYDVGGVEEGTAPATKR